MVCAQLLLREPDGYVLLFKGLDVVQGKYHWPRNNSKVNPIIWLQFDWIMFFVKIREHKGRSIHINDTGSHEGSRAKSLCHDRNSIWCS